MSSHKPKLAEWLLSFPWKSHHEYLYSEHGGVYAHGIIRAAGIHQMQMKRTSMEGISFMGGKDYCWPIIACSNNTEQCHNASGK